MYDSDWEVALEKGAKANHPVVEAIGGVLHEFSRWYTPSWNGNSQICICMQPPFQKVANQMILLYGRGFVVAYGIYNDNPAIIDFSPR